MRKFTRFIGSISFVFAASLIVGCTNAEETMQEEVEREMPVEVDLVTYGALSGSNQLSGTIVAYEEVDVTPKVAGELIEILVKKGDVVKTGDVIARMDNSNERNALEQEQNRLKQAQSGLQKAQMGKANAERGYSQAQAQLRQAEASLAQAREGRTQSLESVEYQIETAKVAWDEAKKSLERMKAMHEEGLISDQEYETAVNGENRARIAYDQVKLSKDQASSETSLRSVEASVDQARIGVQMAGSTISEAEIGISDAKIAVEQAQLSVDAAKDRLDDKTITAPAPGEVVAVNGYVGEMASPGAAFVNLLELDRVKLSINATVDQLGMFEIGQNVDVAVARMDETLTGQISYISATSQGAGLFTIEVEIDNADKKLRPGMFASIVVEEVLAEEGIVIPTKAIVEKQGESFVFVVEDGVAVRKTISVTRFDTEFTAVTGDLKENDQIVVKGQNLLEDGNLVQIMEED
ncbi:efflux RND transporter periplasmic adaptor subunit [bacterium LRH843]|nr:efflux RND transporter periplasmic adaptor subunit [bacterium LRH843]